MNIDYTNNYNYNYNYNKNVFKISKNIDKYTFWNFSELTSFIIKNFKQIILLICVFLIIFIIEMLTQYNSYIFSSPSVIPGLTSQSNSLKKDKKKK